MESQNRGLRYLKWICKGRAGSHGRGRFAAQIRRAARDEPNLENRSLSKECSGEITCSRPCGPWRPIEGLPESTAWRSVNYEHTCERIGRRSKSKSLKDITSRSPQAGARFLDGGGQLVNSEAQASVIMNRRIRNRTYGGVGGRRGISPASYPIRNPLHPDHAWDKAHRTWLEIEYI